MAVMRWLPQSHQCHQDKAVLWHTSGTGKTTLKVASCKLQIQQAGLLLLPKPREIRIYTARKQFCLVSQPTEKLLSHQDNEIKVHTTNESCSVSLCTLNYSHWLPGKAAIYELQEMLSRNILTNVCRFCRSLGLSCGNNIGSSRSCAVLLNGL